MFWVYKVSLRFLSWSYRLTHYLGAGLGFVKYYLYPKDWRRIVRNLRLISRGKISSIRAFFMGGRVIANFMHYWLDVLYYGMIADREILVSNVEVRGKENLDKAFSSDLPVIISTAHFGNWEVEGFWLGENGYRINAVALPHRDRKINEFFNKVRNQHNIEVIPTGRSTRIIGVLKRREILAILGDWDFSGGKSLVEVEFFSRRLLFPAGLGRFAERFQAVVVPIFCRRIGLGRYRVDIFDPIEARGASTGDIVQSYANALERVLEQDPFQWFMFGPIKYAKETISNSDCCIIIPAYNEELHLGNLLSRLETIGINAIVVDDGSIDKTSEIAGRFKFVMVHRLSCNEGKGVAIKEGLGLAKSLGYKWALLMDADGQHLPEEIDRFLSAARSDVGMVCGNRLSNPKGMPLVRRFTNWIMSLIISAYVLQWIPDTQCGYRLIRLDAIEPDDLSGDKYEIETDLILRIKERGWSVVSVSVSSVYHDTAVSYINPVRDTARFIWFMLQDGMRKIWRRIKRK